MSNRGEDVSPANVQQRWGCKSSNWLICLFNRGEDVSLATDWYVCSAVSQLSGKAPEKHVGIANSVDSEQDIRECVNLTWWTLCQEAESFLTKQLRVIFGKRLMNTCLELLVRKLNKQIVKLFKVFKATGKNANQECCEGIKQVNKESHWL